jgi:hypothetical protein
MQATEKPLSLLLILLVSIMLSSCKNQKVEWKGTIEETDGVTVVKNPKEPMYGPEVFSLEEELVIGGKEGDGNSIFSLANDVEVDDEENIYILDIKEVHIKVFDKNGEYLTTIGKKGQGPGELGLVQSININAKNELVVVDNGNFRVNFFNSKGNCLRTVNPKKDISFVGFNPKLDSLGNYYSTTVFLDKPIVELQKFNPELEYLCTFDSCPRPDVKKGFNLYQARMYFAVASNNLIVCSYSEKYEIKYFDSQGNLMKKIIKRYNPVEITEDAKEEARKIFSQGPSSRYNLVFPKYYEALRALHFDEEGKLYVGTHEKVNKKEIYDVFDADGRFIAKIALNGGIAKLKNNKLGSTEKL